MEIVWRRTLLPSRSHQRAPCSHQKAVIVLFLSFTATWKKAIEHLQWTTRFFGWEVSEVLFLLYLFPKTFLVNYSDAHTCIGWFHVFFFFFLWKQMDQNKLQYQEHRNKPILACMLMCLVFSECTDNV